MKADVAADFIQMASRKNLTLYGLLSEILEKIVALDRMGATLGEVVEAYRLFKTCKEIGFVSIPESLWHETVESSLRIDKKGTLVRFGEAGEWIGRYALAKSQEADPALYLANCLTPLMCDASDFSIRGSETIQVRCVNPRYPPYYIEPFSTLLSRAVETLGYECDKRVVAKGMVLLSFQKTVGPEQRVRREVFA